MERALVVVDDTEAHRELLAEAADLAADAGAELVLFSWITPDELEENIEMIESVEQVENTSYGETDSLDIVRNFVDDFADDVLGTGADYDVTGTVTETDALADEIIEAADNLDCDHVFLVGQRRSPTGKVIFGDVAQRVILNFDDYVTITMD